MKNAWRIILSIIILLGATLIFASWAMYSFDLVFSDFEKLSNQKKVEVIPVNTTDEVSGDIVLPEGIVMPKSKIIKEEITADTKEIKLDFVFPKTESLIYKGCNYKVSWTSLFNIQKADLSLIDAGAKMSVGSITSGIQKNIIGDDTETFDWKVGNMWPGKYYISVFNINDTKLKDKSLTFEVKDIPEGTSEKDKKVLCTQE